MWILTEDNTMINTDNITYMECLESDENVYINAYFTVSSASVWSDRIHTDTHKFCYLTNTEDNKNTVKRIFLEIFDSMYSDKKTFNIPKRLGRV